jgi:NAD(P)-dependent dehydrogenase (short-subunit alcohol dehydrogenase family)
MGLAVVEDLVSKGWNVAVFDFSEEAGNAVAERLGERVRFIKGNVVVYNELVAAFDQVFKLWGQIDFGEFIIWATEKKYLH